MAALVATSDVIVSVCPPHAARDVATEVAGTGFDGIYVDANAVAPALAEDIAGLFMHFVDGGIIGPPPVRPGTTRLYLSGAAAAEVAGLWKGSVLGASVLPGPIGAASSLKMAYAGWTKGSAALLLAMRAYAEAVGVGDALVGEWLLSQQALVDRIERSVASLAAKAWRFEGEMEQVAASLEAVGVAPGFHEAAASVYGALADLKGADSPSLGDLIARLAPTPDAPAGGTHR
ncbi:MAG: DUF1932 domain-containing protein [Actinobacteria bacterium]|nr:DUF1932 domain-containing protein [Actinomycetota bacterium]